MKIFFADGKGKGHFENLPEPALKENEILVKICYCGVCGTDQDLFSGSCSFAENGQVTYPVRLGHEWSGIVEKVGGRVTKFKNGDRVVGDNAVACGECEHCISGNFDKCPNTRYVGTIDPVYDGAFSEYFVIPEHHVYKIPDVISLKEAALCEPFSVAYGATKRMNINSESTVAVIGTGCIGMAAAVLSICAGAGKTVVIGRNPEKLKAAKALGAEIINIRNQDQFEEIDRMTGGKGADFVIECSGAQGTFTDSINLARGGGIIGLIGFYEKSETDVNVDTIVSKSLNIFGVMGEYGNMSGVLKILEQKKPNMLPIITDELNFEDCMKGFVRSNYPNSIKTMIKICEE